MERDEPTVCQIREVTTQRKELLEFEFSTYYSEE